MQMSYYMAANLAIATFFPKLFGLVTSDRLFFLKKCFRQAIEVDNECSAKENLITL